MAKTVIECWGLISPKGNYSKQVDDKFLLFNSPLPVTCPSRESAIEYIRDRIIDGIDPLDEMPVKLRVTIEVIE